MVLLVLPAALWGRWHLPYQHRLVKGRGGSQRGAIGRPRHGRNLIIVSISDGIAEEFAPRPGLSHPHQGWTTP